MSIEHSPARAGDAREGHPEAGTPPADRFINEHQCAELTNLSRVTRWRMMRRGEFPAKIRLSPNRTAWKLSSVLRWMSERKAA